MSTRRGARGLLIFLGVLSIALLGVQAFFPLNALLLGLIVLSPVPFRIAERKMSAAFGATATMWIDWGYSLSIVVFGAILAVRQPIVGLTVCIGGLLLLAPASVKIVKLRKEQRATLEL